MNPGNGLRIVTTKNLRHHSTIPMIASFRRLASLLPALLSLLALKGCKPAPPPPLPVGVSQKLAYPVLLIGQKSFDVRDTEDDLIHIIPSSGMNLLERLILDSDGRLFEVTRAESEPGSKSIWLDWGTGYRKFGVEVSERKKPDLAKIRGLLLEQVKAENSIWNGDPKAVAKIESMNSVAEAIEACRTSWEWTR